MKSIEQDDPMELVGMALPVEDTDGMTDAVILEYLFLDWPPEQILTLFKRPLYHLTHQIYHDRGEEYVLSRIRGVQERLSRGWLQGGARDA